MERLSKTSTIKRGEPLQCIDATNADGLLVVGSWYHFRRYGNQDTIHLMEFNLDDLGKVGFDPARFQRFI